MRVKLNIDEIARTCHAAIDYGMTKKGIGAEEIKSQPVPVEDDHKKSVRTWYILPGGRVTKTRPKRVFDNPDPWRGTVRASTAAEAREKAGL